MSSLQPGSVPMWGTFLLMLTTIGGLWLKGRKLSLDSEGGIRDHYAKEVASLRAQVLAVQTSGDVRIANAEKRYEEAIEAADRRHALCEDECTRLRDVVRTLERQVAQLHSTSLRMFEPKASLSDETKAEMRSMEQPAAPGMVMVLDSPCPPFPEVDHES